LRGEISHESIRLSSGQVNTNQDEFIRHGLTRIPWAQVTQRENQKLKCKMQNDKSKLKGIKSATKRFYSS